MGVRVGIAVALLVLLIPSFFSVGSASDGEFWWDDAWSFRQEIIIPFDTRNALAINQPIDTFLVFDHPCWATSEQDCSIRVIMQTDDDSQELESQIYNLKQTDSSHISSCSIVFLIPEQATGEERYYVYYDDEQTLSPQYDDHVSIKESSYFFEPIPGYPFESHFYALYQGQNPVYMVSYEGTFMGYTTSQHVTKLLPNVQDIEPKSGDLFSSFDFRYYYGQNMFDYRSTSQQMISKKILTDGNLMVSCEIISQSENGDVRTTGVYTYYYCPTPHKRIRAQVTHEALQDLSVDHDINTDGTYATLQCGGLQSSSIQDLNFGEIIPFLHVFTELNITQEYALDLQPEYIPEEPDIRILNTEDDVDVGAEAWVSFDEGQTGTVHALLFDSTSVVQQGADERNGIQAKAYEMVFPYLPGLKGNTAAVQLCRNSYESGGIQDRVIPKGFIAHFHAEFFSSPVGGYLLAQQEARLFRSLIPLTASQAESSGTTQNPTTYTLTVLLRHAPSFPMGAGLSVLTGKKYSYITVELYRNQEIVSSSTAVRLPMRSLTSSESASIRLVDIIRSLEFRNVSLLKKVQFSGVEPGVYLVKVYRENPGRGKDREYIGSTPIEIQKDTTVRLPCSPEAKVKIKVSNQKGNGVATVNVRLLKDGVMVAQNITDTQGSAVLTAPSSFLGSYECQMVYQGFQVFDEQVRLRAVRHIIPLSKILELEEYTWVFHLIDTWGLPLDLPVTPQITSEEMVEPVVLPAERVSPTTYQVLHLLPASYQFHLQYKSFVLDETFQVPAEQDSKYVFPVEFPLTLRILDARGIPQYNSLIRISRGGTTMEVSSNTSTHRLSLPPGTYSVVVLSEKTRVAERVVQVMGARSIDVITTQEPLFPLLVILGSLVLLSIALILCILKKSPVYVVFALVLVFSMLALVLPWWSLTGSSSEAETSSTLFLLPLDLVTTVKTPTTLTGNLASLPDVFVQVMVLLPLLMLLGCLFTLVSLLFRHYKKKGVQKVMIGGALLLFLGVIVIFSYAMMVFTEVGVGSYVGHGSVPVSIPGEEALQMSCTWGPGIGFYLCCLLIPILLILLITTLRKKE